MSIEFPPPLEFPNHQVQYDESDNLHFLAPEATVQFNSISHYYLRQAIQRNNDIDDWRRWGPRLGLRKYTAATTKHIEYAFCERALYLNPVIANFIFEDSKPHRDAAQDGFEGGFLLSHFQS